jgi:Cft2 family RNA processing exonuclease
MKIGHDLVAPNCLLITIEDDFRILLDCPRGTKNAILDWERVDVILVSNYHQLDLPYITEYTKFKGQIIATRPTIEFLNLNLIETLAFNISNDPIYSLQDINDCIDKIHSIYYNHPQRLFSNLVITSISSGTGLGTSNWIIKYGSSKVFHSNKIVYSPGWTKPSKPYTRPMEVQALLDAEIVITTQLKPPPKNHLQSFPLKALWPQIYDIIKQKGNIILPCLPIEDLFDLIEEFYSLLDSDQIKIPLHVISPSGKQALGLSGIYSEWLCHDRQLKAMNARQPLLHGELLQSKKIIFHETIESLLTYPGPRVVFCGSPDLERGESCKFLKKTKLYNDYMFLIPDTAEISSDLLVGYPNAKILCYEHQSGYSTVEQFEMLLHQIQPKYVIRSESGTGVYENDIFIDCVLGFESLNLQMGVDETIDLTGAVYRESMNNDPAAIDVASITS